jgi:hypothetical protein
MPIHYRIEENNLKEGAFYYARVLRGDAVGLQQMIANITSRTSLSGSDIASVVTALVDEVKSILASGQDAVIDGLVSFSPTLSGSFETPEYYVTRLNAQLGISTNINSRLRNDVAAMTTYERELNIVKVPIISTFFDVSTKMYDIYTAGDVIRLLGDNLRFDSSKPDEGIFVQGSGLPIRFYSYSVIGQKRIDALVPLDVNIQDMTVELRTRYTEDGSLRVGEYSKTVSKFNGP